MPKLRCVRGLVQDDQSLDLRPGQICGKCTSALPSEDSNPACSETQSVGNLLPSLPTYRLYNWRTSDILEARIRIPYTLCQDPVRAFTLSSPGHTSDIGLGIISAASIQYQCRIVRHTTRSRSHTALLSQRRIDCHETNPSCQVGVD